MASLFTRHPLLFQTAYAELKRQALEQSTLLVGTPGSVSVRDVGGGRFYYRQFYDAAGAKAADYIGAVGADDVEERVAKLRQQIDETHALIADARTLVRNGYVPVDVRTNAVLAALANGGLFRAGAVVVGSHAYGALLNMLGVGAAGFATLDVDVASDAKLALSPAADFAQLLAQSRLGLAPVPGLARGAPSTSYKAPGRDRFRVDLLTSTRGRDASTRAVPELNAHATALPYLDYLVDEPLDSVLLGTQSVVPVKVPRPEAFAWHKLLVSQLRAATSEKRSKDLLQASVLCAVLAEDAPDALQSAHAALPRSARKPVAAAAKLVVAQLERAGGDRAIELMASLSSR